MTQKVEESGTVLFVSFCGVVFSFLFSLLFVVFFPSSLFCLYLPMHLLYRYLPLSLSVSVCLSLSLLPLLVHAYAHSHTLELHVQCTFLVFLCYVFKHLPLVCWLHSINLSQQCLAPYLRFNGVFKDMTNFSHISIITHVICLEYLECNNALGHACTNQPCPGAFCLYSPIIFPIIFSIISLDSL